MTSPVHLLAAGERLYRAIAAMRTCGLRHMPVVGANGQALGMLHLSEALGRATGRLASQIDRLNYGPNLEEIAQARGAQPELAANSRPMAGGPGPAD